MTFTPDFAALFAEPSELVPFGTCPHRGAIAVAVDGTGLRADPCSWYRACRCCGGFWNCDELWLDLSLLSLAVEQQVRAVEGHLARPWFAAARG